MARSARDIIKALGGLTALSTALGHRFPTTVQGWWERDAVPLRHVSAVIAIGRDKGVELTADDFIPPTTAPSAAATSERAA